MSFDFFDRREKKKRGMCALLVSFDVCTFFILQTKTKDVFYFFGTLSCVLKDEQNSIRIPFYSFYFSFLFFCCVLFCMTLSMSIALDNYSGRKKKTKKINKTKQNL